MISSNEIRNRQISAAQNGYNKDEVNALLDEAADTVDSYADESKELYHKLEVLAAKIEEYRQEENSIKSALIIAQKTAESIEREARNKAEALKQDSESKAKALLEAAKQKAEQIIVEATQSAQQTTAKAQALEKESKEASERLVSETREYCKNLISEKTSQATDIISDAEQKANDAINSSKIVAQDILEQAKQISEEIVEKSKEEKQAYDILVDALKKDAKDFITKLSELYASQLDALSNAKLDSDSAETEQSNDNVVSIHEDVESLVSEINEIGDAIPEEITIERPQSPVVEETEKAFDIVSEIIDDAEESEETSEAEEAAPQEQEMQFEDVFSGANDETDDDDTYDEPDEVIDETLSQEADDAESEEEIDPMEAIEAFSRPSRREQAEKSLFDEEEQPFESYFKVKKEDAHLDPTATISLIPPEDEDFDEDDDDEPKFRGFFKKKK